MDFPTPKNVINKTDYRPTGRYLSTDHAIQAEILTPVEPKPYLSKWLIRLNLAGISWIENNRHHHRALTLTQLDRLISVLLTVRARIVQEDRTLSPFPVERYVLERKSSSDPE